MRINCRDCGNKALITKVAEETPKYAKLYCICLEPTCGHGFVSELCFSHTLKPSKIIKDHGTILERLLQLSGDQQMQLLEQLEILT